MIINAADISNAADIVSVVQEFVKLRRAGANWVGCCPFHDEKSGSFTVSAAKGIYKCFGCGKAGNAVTFIMEHEHRSYPEALEWLANHTGIMVKHDKGVDKEEYKAKLSEHAANALVLQKVQGLYMAKRDVAHAYCKAKRLVSVDTLIDFGIGQADDSWDAAMKVMGVDDMIAGERIGVLKSKKDGSKFCTMRHRVTIPIYDGSGKLLGHAGERLPDGETDKGDGSPKYINPAECEGWFEKRNVLFGLHLAIKSIVANKYAVLVEGYWGCINMHDAGMDMAVASMGTALTDEQCKLLKKYTNKVYIMRDGDKAGEKSAYEAVEKLLGHSITPYMVPMTMGMDPDDMVQAIKVKENCELVMHKYVPCSTWERVKLKMWHQVGIEEYVMGWAVDGVEASLQKLFAGMKDSGDRATATDRAVQLLALIRSEITRNEYIGYCTSQWKLKGAELKKAILTIRDAAVIANAVHLTDDDGGKLPPWVDIKHLFDAGFVQNTEPTKEHKVGIFFREGDLKRVTNFTIKPLFHIYESNNNRRLVQVYNGLKDSIVEMPSRALVSKDAFETALIEKGAFYTEYNFTAHHYKRIVAHLANSMPLAFELKTLGWQPEGFFAFSNKVMHGQDMLDYDELGMVHIEDKHYLSMGVSSIYKDDREVENPYENDLYLKYVEPKMGFEAWSKLFCKVYPEHGMMGLSFIFMTAYIDIVTRTTKRPLLYCYGAKGSGKSDFAESITYLFFSGKNAEGKLIQGYNLNPGQGTPFSFFNRIQRFRNCPALMNEFDETTIEDFKFGALKASYDGEGREVGDGDSGKRKKTIIQKVQGTVIIVGQYLSIKDDGSVLSRSLSLPFNLERLKKITDEDTANWKKLKDVEHAGLSGIVGEILKYRDGFKDGFDKVFWKIESQMKTELKAKGVTAEIRILRNYCLAYSVVAVMADFVTLPFELVVFYNHCLTSIAKHNSLLSENNSLSQYWKLVEFMFDKDLIKPEYDFMVQERKDLILVMAGGKVKKDYSSFKKILFLRTGNIYVAYSKLYRERTGKAAPNEETLLTYMKDQDYFIGLAHQERFNDKRTSAYALDYELLGVELERTSNAYVPGAVYATSEGLVDESKQVDMPF